MKQIIFTITAVLFSAGLFAQTKSDTTVTQVTIITTTTDTIVTIDTVKKGRKKYTFKWDFKKSDTLITPKKAPGLSFDFTFSRVDVGFATLIDNGSFNLSQQNRFLRYRSWKSSNFGFDLVQLGYRFSSSFKIYASAGFDWTKFRLREDVTLQRFQPQVTYTQDSVKYNKNNFSSTYLRIPLTFYWRSKVDNEGHRFQLAAGAITGILMNGHTKQKSEENGTKKLSGGYNLAKFQYGAFLRAGYGGVGVFAKYYVNDMFDDSPAQKGLKNFSVGATVGF